MYLNKLILNDNLLPVTALCPSLVDNSEFFYWLFPFAIKNNFKNIYSRFITMSTDGFRKTKYTTINASYVSKYINNSNWIQ